MENVTLGTSVACKCPATAAMKGVWELREESCEEFIDL